MLKNLYLKFLDTLRNLIRQFGITQEQQISYYLNIYTYEKPKINSTKLLASENDWKNKLYDLNEQAKTQIEEEQEKYSQIYHKYEAHKEYIITNNVFLMINDFYLITKKQ